MKLAGVILGFTAILFLNSRDINTGLSLFIGALITGILSSLTFLEMAEVIFREVTAPLTLQLIVIVTVISGLGYVLKETGDLDRMINALIAIFKDGKILSMLLPALIGTLSVPGGAILSAPMIDESGDRIGLDGSQKTVVNLFFRHIFFFAYPLSNGIILISELLKIEKLVIIKYNLLIMLGGIITAYFVLFKSSNKEAVEKKKGKINLSGQVVDFLTSFSPILLIIILALVLKVPFYLAVIIGLLTAVGRNLPDDKPVNTYFIRLSNFFTEGVKYKMASLIIGVMSFKAVIESSGAIKILANFMAESTIPLSLMLTVLGLLTGYLTGIAVAAFGILIPIFKPLIPAGEVGPYISLLFTVTYIGYLVSPIHLCLILTKEYFEAKFETIYKLMIIPGGLMIAVALLKVIVL